MLKKTYKTLKLIISFSSILIYDVRALTCYEILEAPENKMITLAELQTTAPKDIVECLAHLGKEKLAQEEADYIWKTILKVYGDAFNVPENVLSQLHWVTLALQPADYDNITLRNIDVIQNFGLNYHLTVEQLSAIANRVREDFAEKEPEDYSYYDLVALRQILCAFNLSEIVRIRPQAYREAAADLGKLENCNEEVLFGFATLAVQKSAFGSPSAWTSAINETIGVVAKYVIREPAQDVKRM